MVRGWLQDRELRDRLGTIDVPSPPEHQRWYDSISLDPTRMVKVIVANDGAPKGLCGLNSIDLIYRRAELWIYVVDSVRDGTGRSSTRTLLNHAFATLGLRRVGVRVFSFNERALGFFRSVGFVEEGIERDGVFKRGSYHNVQLLSMLADEFISDDDPIA